MKRGRRGTLTRKRSKKTVARSRNMKETVHQRFHICDADDSFHVSADSVGGYTGYMTKTKSLLSSKAIDTKSNSIVCFRLDCSERHWDPAKYRAGTQILPSQVEGAWGPGADAGPTFKDYFIFEPDAANAALIPKLDQTGLNPTPGTKLKIPYTINALPDSSVVPDHTFWPENYVIPNSLLSKIKINLQFSHVMTLDRSWY